MGVSALFPGALYKTGGFAVGQRSDIQVVLRQYQGSYYTYLLRKPDGTPFYAGKGRAYRLFCHEIEARAGLFSHKLNTIRAIWKRDGEVIYEVDLLHDTETAALARERELIQLIGRADLKRGPLTNQTDGGEGTSNPSEESKERHRLTLGGIADDGSDRSTVNRFFLSLGAHASIAIKPVAEIRVRPTTPHPSPRVPSPRQAVALAGSAVANGIMLTSSCRVPRQATIDGVSSIIENGVSRDIAKSGLAKLLPAADPCNELFELDVRGIDYVVGVIGRDALSRLGVIADGTGEGQK